mgnify:CR=1 FL=1
MESYALGIDIGGTKTAVGIFDAGFHEVKRVTLPTQPQDGCRELVRRIGGAYRALLRETGIAAPAILSVGAACPGPLDLEKGAIVHIPTMGFRNEPLVQYLEQELERTVALENDTNAAALCESVFGLGKGLSLVVYVTISTGVGCGIAYRREILDGAAFSAGELGHFKVVRGGRACACGGRGCLEAYASGTAIAAIAAERTGRRVDAKEVFARARKQEPPFIGVVREAAQHLGYAVACVYQLLDPDIVVLGGSVTKDYDVLGPLLHDAVRQYVQEVPGRCCRLEVSRYGGGQVLLGAAYYGARQAQGEPISK